MPCGLQLTSLLLHASVGGAAPYYPPAAATAPRYGSAAPAKPYAGSSYKPATAGGAAAHDRGSGVLRHGIPSQRAHAVIATYLCLHHCFAMNQHDVSAERRNDRADRGRDTARRPAGATASAPAAAGGYGAGRGTAKTSDRDRHTTTGARVSVMHYYVYLISLLCCSAVMCTS